MSSRLSILRTPKKNDPEFRCILVGECAQLYRLVLVALRGEDWKDPYRPTVTDAFNIKMATTDGSLVVLVLYECEETCNQANEEYSPLRQHWYTNQDAYLVCFSKKHRASFERVEHYCAEIRSVRKDAIIYLLGVSWADHIVWDEYGQNGWEYSCSDLRQVEPSVSEAEAQRLCAQLQLARYFECCEKLGDEASIPTLPEKLSEALASIISNTLNQRSASRAQKKCVIS